MLPIAQSYCSSCLVSNTFPVVVQAPLDVPGKNQLGAQPIHWACVNGHVTVVDIMLQVSSDEKQFQFSVFMLLRITVSCVR